MRFALEIAALCFAFGMATASMTYIGSVDTQGNVAKIIIDLQPKVLNVVNR